MSSDAFVYLAAAMLRALVGGLASFAVSARGARRDRRARYGESMLETLGAAHRKLAQADDAQGEEAAELNLRDEAINLWAQTELAQVSTSKAARAGPLSDVASISCSTTRREPDTRTCGSRSSGTPPMMQAFQSRVVADTIASACSSSGVRSIVVARRDIRAR